MSLLIKHAAIVDVLENEIKTGDIYIRNGRFEKIADSIDIAEIEEKEHPTVINGEGLTALPGLIDAHTHVELSMLKCILCGGTDTKRDYSSGFRPA